MLPGSSLPAIPSRRVLLVVFAILLVLLAGCTTPSATVPEHDETTEVENSDAVDEHGSNEDTGSDDTENGDEDYGEVTSGDNKTDESDSEPTDDASVSFDEDEVWDRVAGMMATDAPQPDLAVDEQPAGTEDVFQPPHSDFQEALNATETAPRGNGTSGLAMPGRVFVYPDGPDEEVEQVLVHEYAHAVQFADGMFASWLRDGETTTDQDMVQTSLIEGGAVFVADEYTDEYLDGFPHQSEQMNESYAAAPAGDRLLLAPYHYGSVYVHDEIDSSDELPHVYENPPLTTAEMLAPEDEPPATDLTVSVDLDAVEWRQSRTDTKGALYTQIVLATELEYDEAIDVATAWNDDELVAFSHPAASDQRAFVWTTQWGTEDNADDFKAAFETKLDEREDRFADRTSLERLDDDTTAVVIGPERFHEEVRLDVVDGSVEIGSESSPVAPAPALRTAG